MQVMQSGTEESDVYCHDLYKNIYKHTQRKVMKLVYTAH